MKAHSNILALSAVALLALGTAAQAGVVHTADANTILLWQMDDTSFNAAAAGTDTADSSGNSHNGSVFNDSGTSPQTVSLNATGVTSGATAYSFYGRDSGNRNLVRSLTTGTSGAFTIELWFNVSDFSKMSNASSSSNYHSDPTTGAILVGQFGTAYSWNMGILPDSSGNTNFRFFQNKGTTNTVTTASQALTANTWYYLAMTGDAGGNYNIYLAKEGATSLTLVDSFTANANLIDSTTNAFRVGGTETNVTLFNTQRGFYGLIDEVHYSDIVRDQAYLESAANVPEPAGIALFAIGGLLLTCKRRHA